jgi:hypothetical protein
MPKTKKGGKKGTAKKKTTKKKPATKKGSKGGYAGGSKGGSKGGGGESGSNVGIMGNDPIIIAGGGSVSCKFKPGQFKDKGGGHWKNDAANLVSLTIIDPTNPLRPPVTIPLTPTSQVSIKLS